MAAFEEFGMYGHGHQGFGEHAIVWAKGRRLETCGFWAARLGCLPECG